MIKKLKLAVVSLVLLFSTAACNLENLVSVSAIATVVELTPQVTAIVSTWEPSGNVNYNKELVRELDAKLAKLSELTGSTSTDTSITKKVINAAGGAAELLKDWDQIKFMYRQLRVSLKADVSSFTVSQWNTLLEFNTAAATAADKVDRLILSGGDKVNIALSIIELMKPIVNIAKVILR